MTIASVITSIILLIIIIDVILFIYMIFSKVIELMKETSVRTKNQEYFTREKYKRDYIEEKKKHVEKVVEFSSNWYHEVHELNEKTVWNTDLLDNGHSECYLYVDSKSKYENANPKAKLKEFISENRSEIEETLEKIRLNCEICEEYEKQFEELSSNATQEKCETFGVRYCDYIAVEKEMVNRIKLQIICSYSITCWVIYTTSHGRNHYKKEYHYDDYDISYALRQLDHQRQMQSRETRRRQIERSKVTPSVRYDVMNRDGFRCCLCGRSADYGIELEVDHIVPISKGGISTIDNLQTLCRDCNRGKGAKY